jgi:hypothetical protein
MGWSLDPDPSPIVEPDGTVCCPICGATSFTPARGPHLKWFRGFTALLATQKLRCDGCANYLTPTTGAGSEESK